MSIVDFARESIFLVLVNVAPQNLSMMTKATVKALSVETLFYVRSDIGAAIEAGEQLARAGFSVPKLGQYHDELYVVAEELKRRGF